MEFWWAIVHGVVKSQTKLSNLHFLEMKAAAICEEVRSFASNRGSGLATLLAVVFLKC